MDKIIIKDASFLTYLGTTKEEKQNSQEIFLDIKLYFETQKAGQTDKIEDTIDYFQVYAGLKELIENNQFNLVETIARDASKYILDNYKARKVKIKIKKPDALIGKARYAGVEIERRGFT